ncbi:MAG TPA: hypothetical protein VIJ29_00185 [Candidatus Paceibacterota bacterium]
MKIFDGKVWHDGQKIAWIDGIYVRAEADGHKLGYFQNNFIFNIAGHKIAYIHENELMFENGQSPIPLQHINETIEGTDPLLLKCAVYVLLEK